MVVVESAGLTDVGRKRKGNEDALFVNDEMRIYVVADGMGGHQAGEVASGMVINTIQEYMERFLQNEDAENFGDYDEDLSLYANRLISSIHLANRVVYQVSNSKPSYKGMGSTVSAVMLTQSTIIAANVGDSPIYLIRNGEIESLSVPHTVLAEQMALNPKGSKQLGKKYNHMLTRAMGIERTVQPDICEIQSFKDDFLILASDGLTDKVTPEEILEVSGNRPVDEVCKSLVDLANERGGDDNITVVVLRIRDIEKKKSGVFGWFTRLFE